MNNPYNILYEWNCLEIMDNLIEQWTIVDAIITDPPYWTTACKRDSVIPFEPMRERLNKLIKPNWAIVLFGGNPFQANLIMSNPKMFKHEWIRDKMVGANFAVLKYQPMREHESISVFCKGTPNYFPIKEPRRWSWKKRAKYSHTSKGVDERYKIDRSTQQDKFYDKDLRNPRSIQAFTPRESKKTRGLHPTQKPVALMEYLIKTYTNEWDLVLDFTMWSWSTWVACVNTNRNFIGIEKDSEYMKIAMDRIERSGSLFS